MTYVSPYNDVQVAGGQGTIAAEILDQIKMYNLEQVDAIFVPVGGGGMIAGIAAYIKSVSPSTKMIGCSPFNNACMAKSIV